MKMIVDTNILIHAEDPKEMPENLQELLRIFRGHGHQVFIHPSSFRDIDNDTNEERKKIIKSKLKGYPLIEDPPTPTDEFLSLVGSRRTSNDINDIDILFSIKQNVADFLVTEDITLQKKAVKAGLEERVLSIDSAQNYLRNLYHRKEVHHTLLNEIFMRNLDIEDPFFDSLKEDYGDKVFRSWFKDKSCEGRKSWVYMEKGKIKAMLVLKEENEPILTSPPMPTERRLKISMLKVDISGSKMGELFLKMAFQYCVNNNIFEVYLTHYRKKDDRLILLITGFGFEFSGFLERKGKNEKEEVYVKRFIPKERDLPPSELSRKYYPSFNDSLNVKKFLVPIIPEYHDRLFPEYKTRQMRLSDYSEINVPGNAIKKAYLSHSGIKKIQEGDIILFYRSHDQKSITCIGVVDRTPVHDSDPDKIVSIVGQRTVYSYPEIRKMVHKPLLVILFRHQMFLPTRLTIDYLRKHNVIGSAPQSIIELSHEQYLAIKDGGKIDERFTVS